MSPLHPGGRRARSNLSAGGQAVRFDAWLCCFNLFFVAGYRHCHTSSYLLFVHGIGVERVLSGLACTFLNR
jgi:hypothetical protein